jgi:hypothetical protein
MGMARPFFRPSHVPKEYADALVTNLAKHPNISGVAKELETACLTILTSDGRVSVPCGENFSFYRGKSGDGSSSPPSSSSASTSSATEKTTSLKGDFKTVELSHGRDGVVYACGKVPPKSASDLWIRDDVENSDSASSSEFDPGTCSEVLPSIKEISPKRCHMTPQGIPLSWFLMRIFFRDKELIESKKDIFSTVRGLYSDFFRLLEVPETEDIEWLFRSKDFNATVIQRFDKKYLTPLQKRKLDSGESHLEATKRDELLSGICADLTNAVFCLHFRGIAHGNVKVQNIVMNYVDSSRWRAVLVDLDTRVHFDTAGQGRPLEDRQLTLTEACATPERISFFHSADAALRKDRFALHRLYESRAPTTYCAICEDLVATVMACIGINLPLRNGSSFDMSLPYPHNWETCDIEVVKNHWEFFVKQSRQPNFWTSLLKVKARRSFQESMHNHRPSSNKLSDDRARRLKFWKSVR